MRSGWTTAIALGALLASSCHHPVHAEARAPIAVPRDGAPAGTTFTVELAHPIDSNVPEAPLDAIVLGSITAAGGSTIVKNGAVVAGRAFGVHGPNGERVELELDTIETIHGKTTLSATFAPGQRDASLATLDLRGPGVGYDALLGRPPAAPARPPSAIGGGPREAPHSIHLRTGARLDLVLTRPLGSAGRRPTE
jgi:hypothetical protein